MERNTVVDTVVEEHNTVGVFGPQPHVGDSDKSLVDEQDATVSATAVVLAEYNMGLVPLVDILHLVGR